MFNHGRHGAFVIAAATALALLVPASAFASHDLSIYKNEAQVDLGSDEQTMSVSCMAGDHAIDGMWRVDHADQDDYVQPLDLIAGAVDVLRAAPTSDRTYSFTFEKNAIGRVQVKIFVTCLGDKTVGGDHVHHFSSAFVKSDGTTPALTPATYDTATTTSTGTGNSSAPVISTLTATPCPTGTFLVTPGFTVDPTTDINDDTAAPTDPIAGMMRLFESDSTTTRDWTWKFENSALPLNYTVHITTTWRCLKVRVPTGGFDKHKLITRFRTSTFHPKASRVSEGQLNCGDSYKAILAGFRILSIPGDTATAFSDGTGLIPYSQMTHHSVFDDVFYLGMDPRIKQRAYSFVNRGTPTNYNVLLSALCLNYRTT